MSDDPYDVQDPPADPPEGCSDPLLWAVAYALRRAHRPRADGWCECRSFWPCPSFRLADESLRTAYERSWARSRRGSSTNTGRWGGAEDR
jgi:hypothetical protein